MAAQSAQHSSRCKWRKDVKAACHYLVEVHWLIDESHAGQRGRPRGDYRVNPRLWEVLEQVKD